MTIRRKRSLVILGSHLLFTLCIVAVVEGYALPEAYVDDYPTSPVLFILGASLLCANLRQWGQAYLSRQALAKMIQRSDEARGEGGRLPATHWDMTRNSGPYLIISCGGFEQMRVEGVIEARLAKAKWVGRLLVIIRPAPQDSDPKAWAEALGPDFQGIIFQGGERLTWAKPWGFKKDLWDVGMKEL